MGMPQGAGTVAYNMEDIAGLTQTLSGLLETYNQVNNSFISMMNSIVGTQAFAGAAAAAAGEFSSILNASQTAANEKFNELIVGINNAAESTGNADASAAQAIQPG